MTCQRQQDSSTGLRAIRTAADDKVRPLAVLVCLLVNEQIEKALTEGAILK